MLHYVLCDVLWFFGVTWIVFNTEDPVFRPFLRRVFFTFTFGVIIFIFVPTFVRQAILQGIDIFRRLLRYLHQGWGRYDAFRSGHI